MIKLENYEVLGWEHAIRGMRNPMNSWEKSDTCFGDIPCYNCDDRTPGTAHCDMTKHGGGHRIGPNDHELMMKLASAGPVHGKFRRMITVYVDITAPLYWWKEFDTYKVGTVANSCSTMHKIHAKEFTMKDFSCEHLMRTESGWIADNNSHLWCEPKTLFETIVKTLNACRDNYLLTKDKKWWWQMIQLLPSSYNQKRTVQLNYEVLANMYKSRKNHKLDEWRSLCEWIESLPYSELITTGVKIDVEK